MVHNNVDEPQKHYEKWKKLHIKEYILYDSIYMKFNNRQNKPMVLEGGVMADYERWSLTRLDGCEGIFWGDVKVLCLNCCSILKLLLIIHIDTYIHQNSLKICEFHCR